VTFAALDADFFGVETMIESDRLLHGPSNGKDFPDNHQKGEKKDENED
jgi:hypothetical protein